MLRFKTFEELLENEGLKKRSRFLKKLRRIREKDVKKGRKCEKDAKKRSEARKSHQKDVGGTPT